MILLDNGTSFDSSDYDKKLAGVIGEHLHKQFPNHQWVIVVDSSQGVANIRNRLLSMTWGYVLHLDKIDKKLDCVTRAGGEILERFGVGRGRMDVDRMNELEIRAGVVMGDYSHSQSKAPSVLSQPKPRPDLFAALSKGQHHGR